jgi:hypothetical protein
LHFGKYLIASGLGIGTIMKMGITYSKAYSKLLKTSDDQIVENNQIPNFSQEQKEHMIVAIILSEIDENYPSMSVVHT